MALTFAELKTHVKQKLGNRTSTTGTVVDDDWYGARVNDGYRQLCTFQGPVSLNARQRPVMRTLRFFELQSEEQRSLTTALTSTFVTPQASNIFLVTDVYDRTNNRGLDLMTERDRRRHDPDETGTPRRFRPGGKNGVNGYFIDRIPGGSSDEIDVLEYADLYPAALSADVDTPVVPDVWHPAIWMLGAAEGAFLLDMTEKATEMRNLFYQFIAERKSPVEEMHRTGLAGARRVVRVGLWR